MAFSHVSFVGCTDAACRYLAVFSMLGSSYTLWTYSSLFVYLFKKLFDDVSAVFSGLHFVYLVAACDL